MNVLLREVTDEDLPIFFEHQREPEANRVAAWPARDRDAYELHWRTKGLGSAGVSKQAIIVDGAVAGFVASWTQEDRRMLTYWLGQAFWGRGVASLAVAEFLDHHEAMRPMHAFVATSNVGSRRVLEKCGFRAAGEPVTGEDGVEELEMRLEAGAG